MEINLKFLDAKIVFLLIVFAWSIIALCLVLLGKGKELRIWLNSLRKLKRLSDLEA